MRRLLMTLTVGCVTATLAPGQSGIGGGGSVDAAPVLQDRLLVRLRQAFPLPPQGTEPVLVTSGDRSLDSLLEDLGVVEMRRVFRGFRDAGLAAEFGLDRWIELRFGEEPQDLTTIRSALQAQPSVERADPLEAGRYIQTTPNDTLFAQQYALTITKAPRAWDWVTASTVPVAVVDTGADMNHSDLAANLWQNPGEVPGNGKDDDGNGFVDDRNGWDFQRGDNDPDDTYGHGVHCAGIVGARGNNGLGVSGVLWDVPVMVVKNGGDFGGAVSPSDSAAAVQYAADNGAGVISMSWSFSSSPQVLKDAIDYAAAADVVLCAAAGNDGGVNKGYPCGYNKVMAVISTSAADQRSSYSTHGTWCDLAAPGEGIVSTYLNNGYANLSGTSMACPLVAGAAAMVRGANPTLNAKDTRWVLNYSADDLGPAGFDQDFGWGRLNLRDAVKKAQSLTLSANTASPGDAVTLDLFHRGDGGFLYVLLASTKGHSPGLSLNGFDATDHRQIAINYDPLLFPLILGNPTTGLGVFVNFVGTLDATGHASATFNVLKGPYFAGQSLNFAAVTLDPADTSHITSVGTGNTLKVR